MKDSPKATVVGLVTPHLLRIVDLANEAEKGVKVEWHLREAVRKTMSELGDLYNGPSAVAAYVDGLANAAAGAPQKREAYASVLRAAADLARSLKRD
ncbi:hypothetical protein [Lysobacter olei]